MANQKSYKRENKLTREQEARKQARRNALESKKGQIKTKPSRMDKEFSKMMGMTEAEMQQRLEEIKIRKEEIVKEQTGRTQSKNQADQSQVMTKLEREYRRISKEEQRLEAFPKIKGQVLRIRDIQLRIGLRRAANYSQAKAELEEAMNAQNRVKEIEEELAKLDKYSEEFSKKDTLTEDDKKENIENAKKYNELLKEKSSLTDIATLENNQNMIEVAKAKVERYESGQSVEDGEINKCELAIQNLIAGKSWDDIMAISIEEMQDKKEDRAKEQEVIEAEEIDETEEEVESPIEENENVEQEEEQEEEEQAEEEFEISLDEDEKQKNSAKENKEPNEEIKEEQQQEEPKVQEEQNEALPEVVQSFAERHPRLAKIPFLAKIMDKMDERKRAREEEDKNFQAPTYSVEPEEKKEDNSLDNLPKAENLAQIPQNVEAKEAKEEDKTVTQTPEKEPEKEKTQRDLFMEQLRKMVEEGEKSTQVPKSDNSQTKSQSHDNENVR